jgi:hypothetical protein
MKWWKPVEVDEPARAYCYRKVCQADWQAWERKLLWGHPFLHWMMSPGDLPL